MKYEKLFTRRKDGRYVATYTLDGKKKYLYDRDPEALYKKLQAAKAPVRITFGQLADRWYADSQTKYKDGTWAGYDAPFSRAKERFADLPAADMTSADIAQHLDELNRQGYGERSLKMQRTVYSLIYKHAAQLPDLVEAARYNPAALAAIPSDRKRPKKRSAPRDDATTRIIMGINSNFGLFPYLLICTGLRRGEALGLRWGDVDYKRKILSVERGVTYRRGQKKVQDTKTGGSVRVVPILDMLAVVLKHYEEEDPEAYIFHGEDPLVPMAEATYRRRWHNWCRENGFANKVIDGKHPNGRKKYHWEYSLTAHVLRHGYATLSSRGGLDTSVIKDLLGHENERTTEIYIDERSVMADRFDAIAAVIESKINEVVNLSK